MSGRWNQASFLLAAANATNPILPAAAPNAFDGSQVAIVGNFGTVPVFVGMLDAWGVMLATTSSSTLVGTLAVQASCERGNTETTLAPDVTLTDWTTIAVLDKTSTTPTTLVVSKAVASGANAILLADMTAAYRWMRLLFTFTSGSGSPKITFQQKGYS